MPTTSIEGWRTGDHVAVRGRQWTILAHTRFPDCEALRLSCVESAAALTLLLPFDRPTRAPRSSTIAVMRPTRWLWRLRSRARDMRPLGGLSSAAASAIDLLPYQLEPALTMLGDGRSRVMIADAVGLGKTVQAGLILSELAAAHESIRVLVVVPAGLRGQWAEELDSRFGIHPTVATSSWLARVASELPVDVNPWMIPGIYIASFDFIKRPEVLGPLESAVWDALVVDEAHAATAGTARGVAVQALALRARRVIILTATPHGGDAGQFRSLCRLGQLADGDEPIVIFRRFRAGTLPDADRRTVLLPVRPTAAERRMHRLLERYTGRIWTEARAQGSVAPRLAAVVLRKRALSSAASLALSCRRRLALLAATPSAHAGHQLPLPLDDEDPLADEAPETLLGAPGLADASLERRYLEALVRTARDAAPLESKIGCLVRLLRRIREPAIVFTEYRDTLELLRGALREAYPDAAILHGGMTAAERALAQHTFNERGSLLLATDAASEGLNLHHRCRIVVHFELPWSPSRLEQRAGRVDRVGQSRRVHEIMLVADDTAERLVLAPLARRALRAGRDVPGASGIFEALGESRVAAAIIEGTTLDPPPADGEMPFEAPAARLEAIAAEEARRLTDLRRWRCPVRARGLPTGVAASIRNHASRALGSGLVAVYRLSLRSDGGVTVHSELVCVHVPEWPARGLTTAADVRAAVQRLRDRAGDVDVAVMKSLKPRVESLRTRWAAAAARRSRRERAVAAPGVSAARQLVQAGLFERPLRRPNAAAGRPETCSDVAHSLSDAFKAGPDLVPELELDAVLLVSKCSDR